MRGFLFLFLRPGSTTSAQLSRCWNIINQHNKPLFRPEHAGFLGVGRRSLLGGWGAFPLGFSVGMGQLLEGWDTSTWPRGPDGCGKWREGWMPHGNRGQSLPQKPWAHGHRGSIHSHLCYLRCLQENHPPLCFPQETGAVEGLGAKVLVPPPRRMAEGRSGSQGQHHTGRTLGLRCLGWKAVPAFCLLTHQAPPCL